MSDMDGLPDNNEHGKAALRQDVSRRIQAMTAEERAEESAAGSGHLIDWFDSTPPGRSMLYMPIGNEIDPALLADTLLGAGSTVCVPRSTRDDCVMEPIKVERFDRAQMRKDQMGVPAPVDGARIDPGDLQLVLVPGMAFDRSGRRLGRGGGFYDRFLARLAPGTLKIGFCFRCQVLEEIPTSDHDRLVDAIVTADGLTAYPARNW